MHFFVVLCSLTCVAAVSRFFLADSQFNELLSTISSSGDSKELEAIKTLLADLSSSISGIHTLLEGQANDIKNIGTGVTTAVADSKSSLGYLVTMHNEFVKLGLDIHSIGNFAYDTNTRVKSISKHFPQITECTDYDMTEYVLPNNPRIYDCFVTIGSNKHAFMGQFAKKISILPGVIPLYYNNHSRPDPGHNDRYLIRFLDVNSVIVSESEACTYLDFMFVVNNISADIAVKSGCAIETIFSTSYGDRDPPNEPASSTYYVSFLKTNSSMRSVPYTAIDDVYNMYLSYVQRLMFISPETTLEAYSFLDDFGSVVNNIVLDRGVFSTCNGENIDRICLEGTNNLRYPDWYQVDEINSINLPPEEHTCYPFTTSSRPFKVTYQKSYMTIFGLQNNALRYFTLAASPVCPRVVRSYPNPDASIGGMLFEIDTVSYYREYFYNITSVLPFDIRSDFFPLSVVFHNNRSTVQPWYVNHLSLEHNFDVPKCISSKTPAQNFHTNRGKQDTFWWRCGHNFHWFKLPNMTIVNWYRAVNKMIPDLTHSFPYYLSALRGDFTSHGTPVPPWYYKHNPLEFGSPNFTAGGPAWYSYVGNSDVGRYNLSAPLTYITHFQGKKYPLPIDIPDFSNFKSIIPSLRKIPGLNGVVESALNNFESVFQTIEDVKNIAKTVADYANAIFGIIGDIEGFIKFIKVFT